MFNSKKLVAGLAVFFVFIIYSLGVRHETPVISKPAALENKSSNTTSSNNLTAGTSTTYSSTPANSTASQYKDGTYTGNSYDAYYGSVQVSVTINAGKITNVKFLQYPNSHSTSVFINQQAMPYLQQEAIQSQKANVQLISGATFTSQAFVQSLSSALSKA
ncbi:MAG TPA: FMN-binding protein [Candidatus Dormibacteraeota bacterium]|nr:FMN-binding protein [Candidatus Dormibacteraeota bacterium]